MIDLDRHSGLDSPVHRIEPRSRLLGFAALIASFAVVRNPVLLVPMLGFAAADHDHLRRPFQLGVAALGADLLRPPVAPGTQPGRQLRD